VRDFIWERRDTIKFFNTLHSFSQLVRRGQLGRQKFNWGELIVINIVVRYPKTVMNTPDEYTYAGW
jgi:hypothetical protein